jgi:hypothetical protein
MCWQCEEIDQTIRHYHGLRSQITDEGSLKGIEILIATLEADKKALHPVGSESDQVGPPRSS